MVRAELVCHGCVHGGVNLRQAGAEVAGGTVGADGHVEDVAVEGVVEAVSRHVVGGLQDSGHGDPRHDHGRRREQGPQAGEPGSIDPVRRHGHDAHLVSAVQQRQMDPYTVALGHLDGPAIEKAPARGGGVDVLCTPAHEALTVQGYEQQLAVVLEQHLRTAAPQPLHHVGDQRADEVGRELVRPVENRPRRASPKLSERSVPGGAAVIRSPAVIHMDADGGACRWKSCTSHRFIMGRAVPRSPPGRSRPRHVPGCAEPTAGSADRRPRSAGARRCRPARRAGRPAAPSAPRCRSPG